MTCKYIDQTHGRNKRQSAKKRELTIVFQVPRIRNDRQEPSASRRDSDHIGRKLLAARARQRDRESIARRTRLDVSWGHIVARSAAAAGMRERRFGPRRRSTLLWWSLSGKIHLWTWCLGPRLLVHVRVRTLKLLAFYPRECSWCQAMDERSRCALSRLSPCFAPDRRWWRFYSSSHLRVRTTR